MTMGAMPCWVSVCDCSSGCFCGLQLIANLFLQSEFSRFHSRFMSTVTLMGDAQQDNNSELTVFALERYRVSQFIRNASSPSIHQSKAKVRFVYVIAGTAHLVTGLVKQLPVSILVFQILTWTVCRSVK